MEYKQKLNKIREYLPFDKWKSLVDDGFEQYTKENCDKYKKIMTILITSLINLGEYAYEKYKAQNFEIAVKSFTQLNDETEDILIETGEREELIELFEQIADICGLEKINYRDGKGIASDLRDW